MRPGKLYRVSYSQLPGASYNANSFYYNDTFVVLEKGSIVMFLKRGKLGNLSSWCWVLYGDKVGQISSNILQEV